MPCQVHHAWLVLMRSRHRLSCGAAAVSLALLNVARAFPRPKPPTLLMWPALAWAEQPRHCVFAILNRVVVCRCAVVGRLVQSRRIQARRCVRETTLGCTVLRCLVFSVRPGCRPAAQPRRVHYLGTCRCLWLWHTRHVFSRPRRSCSTAGRQACVVGSCLRLLVLCGVCVMDNNALSAGQGMHPCECPAWAALAGSLVCLQSIPCTGLLRVPAFPHCAIMPPACLPAEREGAGAHACMHRGRHVQGTACCRFFAVYLCIYGYGQACTQHRPRQTTGLCFFIASAVCEQQ